MKVPPRKGSRHGSAKLNEAFVIKIRRQGREVGYFPVAPAARAKGVTYRAVKEALNGTTYTHVDSVVKPFRGPTRKPAAGCVVRIDSDSTHGWQARFRGKSKFFSDGVHGAKAKKLAKDWLTAAVTKGHKAGKKKR